MNATDAAKTLLDLDPLQLTPKEMADYAVQARDLGINYIGACCGRVAMHIREMARVLNKLPEDSLLWKKVGEKPMAGVRILRQHEGIRLRETSTGPRSPGPVIIQFRSADDPSLATLLCVRWVPARAPEGHRQGARSETIPGVRWHAERR